ncbi:suppressor protein SRP40 [Spatholobus suberectus]|nr:suppressor protein SRP40 [Spatholobus suberectus]
MIMEKAYKQQICSKLCSNLGTLPLIILVLVLVSFYFFFSISESFPFVLTIPIALLSTMFLVTLTKKKGPQNENLVQDELQKEELHPSLDVTHDQRSETGENHEQQAEAHSDYSFPTDSESSNFSIMDGTFELNVQEHRLQDDLQSDYSLPSDSESSDGSITGECFEIGHNGNQNEDISDSLDSDDDYEEEEEEEDSLIEINLPSSHFSDLTEDPKQKLQSKLPDFLPDSIFKQQGLTELLAEINDMNEDENLIEIDISMGSINNPDFRLKQELAYFEDECVLSD